MEQRKSPEQKPVGREDPEGQGVRNFWFSGLSGSHDNPASSAQTVSGWPDGPPLHLEHYPVCLCTLREPRLSLHSGGTSHKIWGMA